MEFCFCLVAEFFLELGFFIQRGFPCLMTLLTLVLSTVENNCGYHLFESDSEEEEEEVTEMKDGEEPPKKKSAFQVNR